MKYAIFLCALMVFVATLTLSACLMCAYESGEEAAQRRYHDAAKRIGDCEAAGGERSACQARFGIR